MSSFFFFLLLLFKKMKEESHQLENQTEAQYRRVWFLTHKECSSSSRSCLQPAHQKRGKAIPLPLHPLPRKWVQHENVGSISSLCSLHSLSLLLQHLFFAWCSLNVRNDPGILSTSFVFLNEVITSPPKESEHVCLNSSEEVCSELKHKSKKIKDLCD